MTNKGQLICDIKHAVKVKYAWPGGYPLYILMSDGESLCVDCAGKHIGSIAFDTVQEIRGCWQAQAVDINYEDGSMLCVHCNKLIESAYNG